MEWKRGDPAVEVPERGLCTGGSDGGRREVKEPSWSYLENS